MTYGELTEILSVLKPGGSIPDSLDVIIKLVLGKMSRRKLKCSQRTAEITVDGNTEFLLSTYIPDFFDFKIDIVNNRKRGPYFYQSTVPYFIEPTTKADFNMRTSGGACMISDGTLHVNFPAGSNVETLYVPIYGKYLVLDSAGGELKEKPENDDDTFIFDSSFDDVLVDGCLLYLNRKDLDDTEFMKANQAWINSLNELVFYG